MGVWPARLMPLDVSCLNADQNMPYATGEAADCTLGFVGTQNFLPEFGIALASEDQTSEIDANGPKDVFMDGVGEVLVE